MQKIVKIVLVVVGLIGAALWFGLPEADAPSAIDSGAISGMFWITYLLLFVAVAVSLVYTLKNVFSNPAGLKKMLMVLGGFIVIVIISYVLSSGTDVRPDYQAMTEEWKVKYIGMGINMFYILTAAAVVLLIIPGVKKLIGK